MLRPARMRKAGEALAMAVVKAAPRPLGEIPVIRMVFPLMLLGNSATSSEAVVWDYGVWFGVATE
jgi:hypothetical protein